ncbi:MAG: prepilin-type N-terminal cleavage/methylation domain-containing protein [Planctomycetes bacterium]|nr:prepilin-type N-terminal cleavage/methylation domain-containing protein [Planctomycetota bacterium]
MTHHPGRGITLIELIVVVSILAILAGALVPRVTNHMAESRDARRLADVKTLAALIERFHADHGRYPESRPDTSFGGWDVSSQGSFLHELVERGYLRASLRDPLDDSQHYYAYYRYEKGTAGCVGDGPFYVLGVKAFETAAATERHRGGFRCAERDWSREMAYVSGGGTAQP